MQLALIWDEVCNHCATIFLVNSVQIHRLTKGHIDLPVSHHQLTASRASVCEFMPRIAEGNENLDTFRVSLV